MLNKISRAGKDSSNYTSSFSPSSWKASYSSTRCICLSFWPQQSQNLSAKCREATDGCEIEIGASYGAPGKSQLGVVLSQSIKPGTKVKEGSIVDLTVSKLAVVKVPNLNKIGKQL